MQYCKAKTEEKHQNTPNNKLLLSVKMVQVYMHSHKPYTFSALKQRNEHLNWRIVKFPAHSHMITKQM